MDFRRVMVDSAVMSASAKSFRGLGSALRLSGSVLFACGAAFGGAGDSLLGRKAPDWTGAVWLNAAPLQLPQLAGKVVLIRWWTAPGCPYCRATAPALNSAPPAAIRPLSLRVALVELSDGRKEA